jgi:hypothetical protein
MCCVTCAVSPICLHIIAHPSLSLVTPQPAAIFLQSSAVERSRNIYPNLWCIAHDRSWQTGLLTSAVPCTTQVTAAAGVAVIQALQDTATPETGRNTCCFSFSRLLLLICWLDPNQTLAQLYENSVTRAHICAHDFDPQTRGNMETLKCSAAGHNFSWIRQRASSQRCLGT